MMKTQNKFYYYLGLKNFFLPKKIAFAILVCWVLKMQVLLCQPVLLSGFPKIIDESSVYIPQPITPQVADINNDGIEEIVIKGFTPPYKLFIIQMDGSDLEGWPVTLDDEALAIGIGDLDHNGTLEIVARSHYKLYAWHGDGSLVNGFPQTLTQNTFPDYTNTILLYDIDNDSKLEIITTTYNAIMIHKWDGSLLSGWPITLPFKSAGNPSICDIEKNGLPQIIVGGTTANTPPGISHSKLYVFNANGDTAPGWPALLDSNYYSNSYTTVADVDNDGKFEIIAPQSRRREDSSGIEFDGRISIYASNGVLLRRWNIPLYSDWRSIRGVSVGNFLSDSFMELAVVDYMGVAFLFNYVGQLQPGWPILNTATYPIPILSDIDNDAVPEIILGHIQSVSDTGKLFFFTYSGDSLWWSPLKVYGNTGLIQPIIRDLDHNGYSELILVTNAGHPLRQSILNIYSLPHSIFSLHTSPWAQTEHDRHNTFQYGYIPSDNVVSVPAFEDNPLQFSLSQNYPNPFNPKTAIGFSLLAVSNVTLKVYDILGKEVATLIHSRLMDAGKHEVNFDAGNVPSGIYYYRLTAGKFTETKKFVVVR